MSSCAELCTSATHHHPVAKTPERETNVSEIGRRDYILWMFDALEAFAFIMPAFPADIRMRLFILYIYWVGHYFHLQTAYLKLKREYTKVK